jgi:hypothetical protein
MMSEYETRLYEALRSLFPLAVKPLRQTGEQNVKIKPAIGAIQLDAAKVQSAEDLSMLFSGGAIEPRNSIAR